jgi:hypothetical protein
VERGDTGLGRDAYGLPRRRRPGEHRAYRRRGEGDEAPGADGVNGPRGTENDYYSQLLRRPDEFSPRLRQPGRARLRQPGRFPAPGTGTGGFPPGGVPGNGDPANGRPPVGDVPNGRPPAGGQFTGGPGSAGQFNGGAGNGGQFSSGPGNGGLGNGGPGNGGQFSGGPGNGGPGNGGLGNGGLGNGRPMPGRQYWLPNGRRVPPGYDQPYRPQTQGPAGGTRGRPGPGQVPGRPAGRDPLGDGWARPGWAPGPPPQAAGVPPAGARGPYGAPGGPEARERPGARAPHGIGGGPVPAEASGPVIRQRETAVPAERAFGTAQTVASIAPDGLEAFARDLRALRAKAELDYPEMAELSHYTMRTLASAAGGLRLPTLPVAVAYVRACGGNVTEWEERWQKLAAKLTADAAKKRRPDDDDERPEPADPPAIPEPPALKPPAAEAAPDAGEVYVITSAKPRQPGWPGGPGGFGGEGSPPRPGGSGGVVPPG